MLHDLGKVMENLKNEKGEIIKIPLSKEYVQSEMSVNLTKGLGNHLKANEEHANINHMGKKGSKGKRDEETYKEHKLSNPVIKKGSKEQVKQKKIKKN